MCTCYYCLFILWRNEYAYLIERAVDILCCNNERETAFIVLCQIRCKINLSCFDSIVMYIS